FGPAPLPAYHRARARPHPAHLVGPTHDLEPAVEMLDDDAAALDPIAAIHVANAEIVVNGGVMDVAANHPVDRVAACFVGKGALEFADVVHGVLDLQLRPLRQRPVGKAEPPAQRIEHAIDGDGGVVGPAAEMSEPGACVTTRSK